jgi:probable F420-dependent oxidoreductase
MRLGVHLPQTEIGDDPGAIRAFAQAVESIGFSHLMLCDHVLGADRNRPGGWSGPYDVDDAFHEPLVTLGFVAGLTTRLGLVTSVLVLPQRQTALVAKQAAQVDVLSGGRLELGVGTGWNQVEYEALGADFAQRGARQEEQVQLIRRLWAEESVDFEGRWHRVQRAGIKPRPARRIPIWFGGGADPLLRRAARLGDGWIPGGDLFGPRQAAEPARRLRRYLLEAGRDPDAFPIEGGLLAQGGNAEVWRRTAREWCDLGATRLYFWTMNAGLERPDDHIEAARRFWDALHDWEPDAPGREETIAAAPCRDEGSTG